MQRCVVGSLALVSLFAAGCIVPPDAKPAVGVGANIATKFVHRGMTLVDKPVLQSRLGVQLPTIHGDQLQLDAEGSMDLYNDTGNAWFPDGHAGRLTQIEFQGSYSKQVGDFALRGGIHSYNLPNGLEFPNGERGGTTEAFLLASTTVLEATPYFSVHYDYDEVRGAYYRGGISEDIPLTGVKVGPVAQWAIALDGSIAYVSEAQAAWMYGIGTSGLADLRGEAVLRYQYDERTSLRLGAHGSMIVDSELDRWFSLLGIDSDPIWFTLGVAWVF